MVSNILSCKNESCLSVIFTNHFINQPVGARFHLAEWRGVSTVLTGFVIIFSVAAVGGGLFILSPSHSPSGYVMRSCVVAGLQIHDFFLKSSLFSLLTHLCSALLSCRTSRGTFRKVPFLHSYSTRWYVACQYLLSVSWLFVFSSLPLERLKGAKVKRPADQDQPKSGSVCVFSHTPDMEN